MAIRGQSLWTPEQDQILTSMRDAGLSSSTIAARLGKTRNAVIGRAARLGLAKPANPAKQKWRKARRADGALANRLRRISLSSDPCGEGDLVPPTETLPAPPAPEDWLTFEQLGRDQCRWPAGEGDGMRFCGAGKAHPSLPYCAHHHRMAYDKPNQKLRQAHMKKVLDQAA